MTTAAQRTIQQTIIDEFERVAKLSNEQRDNDLYEFLHKHFVKKPPINRAFFVVTFWDTFANYYPNFPSQHIKRQCQLAAKQVLRYHQENEKDVRLNNFFSEFDVVEEEKLILKQYFETILTDPHNTVDLYEITDDDPYYPKYMNGKFYEIYKRAMWNEAKNNIQSYFLNNTKFPAVKLILNSLLIIYCGNLPEEVPKEQDVPEDVPEDVPVVVYDVIHDDDSPEPNITDETTDITDETTDIADEKKQQTHRGAGRLGFRQHVPRMSLHEKNVKLITFYSVSSVAAIISSIITIVQKNQSTAKKILFVVTICLMVLMLIINIIIIILTSTDQIIPYMNFRSVVILQSIAAIINASFAVYFIVLQTKKKINVNLWTYIVYFVLTIILIALMYYSRSFMPR